MTEAEWLECTIPEKMLLFLRFKASDRKLRLFASGCCRRIWYILPKSGQRAVENAERYADSLIGHDEITSTLNAYPLFHRVGLIGGYSAIRANAIWSAPRELLERKLCASDVAYSAAIASARDDEHKTQCSLLRHIVGNPFQPVPGPTSWPSTATALAKFLYNGDDCHYALADALFEAGHAELAAHFKEPEHPKGCWAMDLILRKE
jgi:hypothetical protein